MRGSERALRVGAQSVTERGLVLYLKRQFGRAGTKEAKACMETTDAYVGFNAVPPPHGAKATRTRNLGVAGCAPHSHQQEEADMAERWYKEQWICCLCGTHIDVRVLRDTDTREELAGTIESKCRCR